MVACSRGPAYSSLTVRRSTHSAKASDSLGCAAGVMTASSWPGSGRRGVWRLRGQRQCGASEFVMFRMVATSNRSMNAPR